MLSWLFSGPLPIGAEAPDFKLANQNGRAVSLSSLRGRPVVLVFYPGDDTPVCTKQLCEFRDNWALAEKYGAQVLGINNQRVARHGRFHDKHKFPFPLLVDEGQRVAAQYQANGLWWVRRTVYLIDAAGIIRFARRGKPHPSEVFAALPR